MRRRGIIARRCARPVPSVTPRARALHRQELIAEDNRRIAHALVRLGKAAEASSYARRAVDIFTCLRSPDLEAARATLRECEG